MRHVLQHKFLVWVLIAGILTTLMLDWSRHFGIQSNSVTFDLLAWLAIPFRFVTYAVLLLSFGLLARELRNTSGRAVKLWAVWGVTGLFLIAFDWVYMAFVGDPYMSPALKRHSPSTLASFAPGWTMAELYLGKGFPYYTWTTAITAEVIGLVSICGLTAGYLRVTARWIWLAFLAPLVFVIGLTAYNLAVPWSYTIDFDYFIGDALLGPLTRNLTGFPVNLLIWGGFTGPAVWASLLAIANVVFISRWKRETETAP